MIKKSPGLVGNPIDVYILAIGSTEVKNSNWSTSFLILLINDLANLLNSSLLGLEELMQFLILID
jgi:hypothetical protein